MAQHGESHGHHESSEKKKKHGGWMERMRTMFRNFALGTIVADCMLVAAVGVMFPPYILNAALLAGFISFTGEGQGDSHKKHEEKGHGSHGHGSHH